jgi:hypothetical protein
MTYWSVGVVASRRRIPGALVAVVAGMKLGVEPVLVIRHNMPPIVAILTLGVLAAAVVLTATTVVAAIILVTIELATGGLTAVGGSVLATIRRTLPPLPGPD